MEEEKKSKTKSSAKSAVKSVAKKSSKKQTAAPVMLFAHRGCSARFPENTLPAFEAALKNKIPAVELDVHLTKDDKLVIIHDHNCERTTGQSYTIAKTDFATLRTLNAAHTFNQKGSTNCKIAELVKKPKKTIVTPIPTLEELFVLAKDNFFYDIEVKVKCNLKKTVKLISELAKKYNLEDKIMLSSFNPFTVRIAKSFNFAQTSLIYGEEEDKYPVFFSKILRFLKKKIANGTYLKPRRDHAKLEVASENENETKTPVATWTVDKKEEAISLIEHGVVGLCSNHPEDLLK